MSRPDRTTSFIFIISKSFFTPTISLQFFLCENLTMNVNPLSVNPQELSNTLKQFVGNCLSVFDHFLGLAFKALSSF